MRYILHYYGNTADGNEFISLCNSESNLEHITNIILQKGPLMCKKTLHAGFIVACSFGNYEIAKFIHASTPKLDIHIDNDAAFIHACDSGHLNIAMWLNSLSNINTIAKNEAFKEVCSATSKDYLGVEQNSMKVAQWLLTLGGIDVAYKDCKAFREACKLGNIGMAMWLHSSGKINVKAVDNYAFINACKSGKIEVVRWLYSIDNTVFNNDRIAIFKKTCYCGKLNVAKLLFALGGITASDIGPINNYQGDVKLWLKEMLNR